MTKLTGENIYKDNANVASVLRKYPAVRLARLLVLSQTGKNFKGLVGCLVSSCFSTEENKKSCHTGGKLRTLLSRKAEITAKIIYFLSPLLCGLRAKDITTSITCRREARKEEALDERGPSSIRRTLQPSYRQIWGNLRNGTGAHMGFFERRDIILN